MMTFSEIEFDTSSNGQWLCFYLISLVLPLIMFNLLVAVMSDTFERVREIIEEMDFKAMTQLILESDIVLHNFYREDNRKLYLQRCIVGSELEIDVSERLKFKLQNCIKEINNLTSIMASLIQNYKLFRNPQKHQIAKKRAAGHYKSSSS